MGEEDNNNLGRLEKVDLREVWKDEASNFTPWLAENSEKFKNIVLPLTEEFDPRDWESEGDETTPTNQANVRQPAENSV